MHVKLMFKALVIGQQSTIKTFKERMSSSSFSRVSSCTIWLCSCL